MAAPVEREVHDDGKVVMTDGRGTFAFEQVAPEVLLVTCGKVEIDPDDRRGHTATNPTVLVEVPSPTTEDYDRGEKLAHYKRIESLREVVLVAHDERRVDLWRRVGDHWTQLTFRAGEAVVLESLECALRVDDVYFDPLA